ncbi:MAG: hypothetical protein ACR2FS_04645 [Phormidesmis sp.]
MGISAFNRARRMAADAQGKPPGTFMPLNYTAAREVAQGEQRAAKLLTRLNEAKDGAALADLPTIGPGAGKVLVANRPENGYRSLEEAIALNKAVCKTPYTLDWEKVLAYLSEAE